MITCRMNKKCVYSHIWEIREVEEAPGGKTWN